MHKMDINLHVSIAWCGLFTCMCQILWFFFCLCGWDLGVIPPPPPLHRLCMGSKDLAWLGGGGKTEYIYTVEPLYNEVLGTIKITLLYQVSHYIRVKKQRNIKSWDQQNYLVIRGFCYIRPRYNEVPLY